MKRSQAGRQQLGQPLDTLQSGPGPSNRLATTADLRTLLELESTCFTTDRISRRSFTRLLRSETARTLVSELDGRVVGYAMVLLRRNTALARLYSIAVHPDARGAGVARSLLADAEQIALEHGSVSIRLEVAPDNEAALKVYHTAGYRETGRLLDYYEDHRDALRLEKRLARHGATTGRPIVYYEQSLEFTCGPAALMMAMHALDPSVDLDRATEVRIWREATTVYMTSGHGGCGPYGLALAAHRRGFTVEVHTPPSLEPLFVDSVRSEHKREVIRLVEAGFVEEMAATDIVCEQAAATLADLDRALNEGRVPVVLISSYRICGERAPHWVVVAGADDGFLYLHDPYVADEEGRTRMDSMSVPIARKEFLGMSRYGRTGQRAALIIGR